MKISQTLAALELEARARSAAARAWYAAPIETRGTYPGDSIEVATVNGKVVTVRIAGKGSRWTLDDHRIAYANLIKALRTP